MPKEQRADFERRLLALVRDEMDNWDEDYPDGWEITDFVVTARAYFALEPGTPIQPWDGGPYPGWGINAWTRGSSSMYWHDAELLQQALDHSTSKHYEFLERLRSEDDETDDADEE